MLGFPGMKKRKVQLPSLQFRAALQTVNNEARTVETVFSTGADVLRSEFWTGEEYIERLSMEKKAIRMDRLTSGAAPVLNTHNSYSLDDAIGVVTSARIKDGQGVAELRFAKDDPDADRAWNKISQGVLQNVSVGYRVHKYEETEEDGMKVRTARDWEPFEISVVPMGADPGAQLRAEDTAERNDCVITRSGGTMDPEDDVIVESTGTPKKKAADPKPEPTDHDKGIEVERTRAAGIASAVGFARMPSTFIQKWIDEGVDLLVAQNRALEFSAKRIGDDGARPNVIVGDDQELIHQRKGMINALEHRGNPEAVKLEEYGRRYRGNTLSEMGEFCCRAAGIKTSGLSKSEKAGVILGLSIRGGMHTTSDFPNILGDVFNKTLRRAYDEFPPTWGPITRMVFVPDFKNINRVQLGDAPELKLVEEHGEFTRGTLSEGKETYKLGTYGRVIAITRQVIINDDTGAFTRLPMEMGKAARHLEADLVWAQITANANLGDAVALFHTTHGNLAAAGTLTVARLGTGRSLMRRQTGLDYQKLNIMPKYLIVPAAIETLADQLVTSVTPEKSSSVNPFSGKLTVIAEPRLDDTSETQWYLAADTAQIDIIEMATLEGEGGPMTESRVGFDCDGLELKVRHDVGVKVLDFRGLFRNG